MTRPTRLPADPALPSVDARVTPADVKGAVREDWRVIVLAWALGIAVIVMTWNGSLFG